MSTSRKRGTDMSTCEDCRYWSDLIASADADGVRAMCLNPKSRVYRQMTVGRVTCTAWRHGKLGAVDQPGGNPYDEGISLRVISHPRGPKAKGDINPESLEIVKPKEQT